MISCLPRCPVPAVVDFVRMGKILHRSATTSAPAPELSNHNLLFQTRDSQINGSGIIFKPELALKVWGEFEGNNSAAFSAFGVADNMPDVFGEVGLSIEVASLANGWSGNLKGDTQFAEDFISFGGYVGLRKNF